jgi:hypothetical protein
MRDRVARRERFNLQHNIQHAPGCADQQLIRSNKKRAGAAARVQRMLRHGTTAQFRNPEIQSEIDWKCQPSGATFIPNRCDTNY